MGTFLKGLSATLDLVDYQGPIDFSLLKPRLGDSYRHLPDFKDAIEAINRRQFVRAISQLETLSKQGDRQLDALHFQAEIYFVFEDHQRLREVCRRILDFDSADLQGLWLLTINHLANQDQKGAEVYRDRLRKIYPEWDHILENYLQLIADHWRLGQIYTPVDQLDSCECVLVLGCGLTSEGHVTKTLKDRLDQALKVLNKFPQAVCLVSGGAVSTPYNEAHGMASYLLDQGLASDRILKEGQARDTVGNCLMSRQILEARSLKQICLVTSPSHLPRSMATLKAALLGRHQDYQIQGTAPLGEQDNLPLNEQRLFYSTVFRAAELYSLNDLERR